MKPTPERKILPAFLLSTFLGTFGAHRFYVGKPGSGALMLVLTLTIVGLMVTSIWNFIDWIRIMTGNFRDGDGARITDWT